MVKPLWLTLVYESYNEDEETKELLRGLSINDSDYPEYKYCQGIIRYKERIYIGKGKDLRNHVIANLHDSVLGGHYGIQAIYQRVKMHFHWPVLKSDVENYVKHCEICKRGKGENGKYPGLLQPLPIPDQVWQHISMDFIEGSPKS